MTKGTQEFIGRTDQALTMYLKQDEGCATASTKQIFRSPDRDRQRLHKPFISSFSFDPAVAYGSRLLIDAEIIYPLNTDDSFDSLCLYVFISRATDQVLDLSLKASIYRNDVTKSIQKASIYCDHLVIPPSNYYIKLGLIDKDSKEIVSVTDSMQLRVTSADIFLADSAKDFIIKTFAFKLG
jgi:hypothetical protein